jgi:hypothetical protein
MSESHDREGRPRKRHRRKLGVAFAAFVVELGAVWLRAGRPGGNVVVRCRDGHLYTTLWIPGASIKSVRLGPWRLQRCPVGRHWTLVTPVKESGLSGRQRRRAREIKDIRVP